MNKNNLADELESLLPETVEICWRVDDNNEQAWNWEYNYKDSWDISDPCGGCDFPDRDDAIKDFVTRAIAHYIKHLDVITNKPK